MSTSLYWAEPPKERKEHSVDYLKHILAKYISNSDGSCSENLGNVGKELIPFLQGIAASADRNTVEDAKALIDAINKHGSVELMIY